MIASTSTRATTQNKQTLQQVWETLQPDSCPYFYNFHMHTLCSDGQLSPTALIEQAVKIGLKGLSITDHHTTRGYQIAQTWLDNTRQQQPNRRLPHLWTGVEISAELLDTEVHILGYAFDPEHPAMQPYIQSQHPKGKDALAAQVIDSIHKAGGLVVLAHPVRYRRPAEDLIPAAADLGIDGVETYYAYNNPKPWQPSPSETQRVDKISQAYGLFNTCGTDTHGLSLLQRL